MVPGSEKQKDISFFKVLVAEDNLINQKILRKMLEKMRICFKIVDNGQEALEALRNDHFDLALLDCYMQELNGFETAAAIRHSNERFAKIPLIAFSAGLLDRDFEASLRSGMDDVLMKPITFDQFQEKLQQWTVRIYGGLAELDTVALDKIRVFDDQHQTLLRTLLQLYSENTQDELYKMRDLIAENRLDLVRKKAHMLKSSAAQLGALRFEKFCILMEYDESLDVERAQKIYEEMSLEYESSRKRLLEYCQNYSQISSIPLRDTLNY